MQILRAPDLGSRGRNVTRLAESPSKPPAHTIHAIIDRRFSSVCHSFRDSIRVHQLVGLEDSYVTGLLFLSLY